MTTPTPEQQRVIDAPIEGPHLVNAGAGTGKTFTLVERARALVERRGLDPSALLLITFTNAAAAEIVARIDAAFGTRILGRPTCGTFHAVAAGVLREFAYEVGASPDLRVIDEGRARALFRRVLDELRDNRLGVDASSFPLLYQTEVLERDLADLAMRLKQLGRSVDAFEATALGHSAELELIGFGAVRKLGAKGQLLKNGLRPDPERTPDERRDEAARERQNVRVAGALMRRFDELLATEALLTYGDVLVRARTMLEEHPAIAATLRARWRHAIVDEFQDTNPLQIAFLRAIFGPELRPVLAVGDLRQAIYAFNGADPQGIVRFSEIAHCQVHPLTENRRSFQPILDAAHHALAGRGGIPEAMHAPLAAHRGAGDPGRVRFQIFQGPTALLDEAAAIAARIRALVDEGVSPRECAILLRTRTRAPLYTEALRQQGIAVQLEGGVGFFEAPEVREVRAWLRLVENPDDALAVVGALQSAAIGLGDGLVARLAMADGIGRAALIDPIPGDFDDVERERLERFRAIARIACGLADGPLVDAVRTIAVASGAAIARAHEPGAEQVRANLEKLVRLAAELAHDRPLARVRDFVNELTIRDELELDLPPAELEGERVVIATIHGAKGREWRYVFLANCSPQTFPLRNNRSDRVVDYDEATGTFALKYGSDGRPTLRWYLATNPHDATGKIVERAGKAEQNEEEFRLLYVALTRARDAVFVSGRTIGTWESDCAKAVRGWFEACGHDLAEHGVALAPTTAVARGSTVAEEAPAAETLFARMARLVAAGAPPERRGALSYSAMALHESCPRRARYHYVLGLPDLTDDAPPASGGADGLAFRDPARFGRIVHKALEYDTRARIEGAERDLDRFVADALEEEEGTADEAEAARRAVAAARAVLDRYAPLEAERRFTIALDGVRLGGYIDLLARDDDGQLVVLDYKTGRTNGEHYALQFALYRRAVLEELGEEPRIVLLRIGADTVSEEEPPVASDAALATAIAGARDMASDEPRPGPPCRSCPYAGDVCRDGARFAT